ncbi:MAG: hypothetical protein BRC25_01080 [Parcubacteria group bacterium SW_6_46_9]|nr:MAG: hypothetical protein BRC25_01080 [Parcubacteria group bacterium SW_6_46_9]
MSSHANHSSGFTLIELLVVIAIISLLSSAVLASLSGARANARDTRRRQDMQQIQTAIEQYRLDNSHIPGQGSGCNTTNGRHLSNESFCVVNELKDYFGGSVPTDPKSGNSGFYYAYDPYHWDSEDICDGSAAAISVNRLETNSSKDRETTKGGDEGIDQADFNRIICPE